MSRTPESYDSSVFGTLRSRFTVIYKLEAIAAGLKGLSSELDGVINVVLIKCSL